MSFVPVNFFGPDGKQWFYAVLSIAFTIISGYILCAFWFPSLSGDSSYYLKIAYDLAEGMSFFIDLNCSYTPLVIYYLSVPFYFDKNIGLELLYAHAFIFYPLIAYVFYKVLKYFSPERNIRFFFSVLLIAAIFVLLGAYIFLEPFVLLFQLLALWLLLGNKTRVWSLCLVGFLVFLAFFSKQYGLFIVPAILYFVYKEAKNVKLFLFHIQFVCYGFLAPLLFLTMYFSFYRDIAPIDHINRVFGISVLTGDDLVTGIDYTLSDFFEQTLQFILKFPFALLIPIFLLSEKKKVLSHNTIFSLLLLAGSLCQLYFAAYDHYFQLIAPYVIIALLSFPKDHLNKNSRVFLFMCMVFIAVSTFKLYSTYVLKRALYEIQRVNVPILKSKVPENSEVYLHGVSPSYYFLCKYNSANATVLGYKYPSELTLERIGKNMRSGSYIMVALDHKDHIALGNHKKVIEMTLKKEYRGKMVDDGIAILKKE